MGKIKRKWFPFERYELEAIQSWLEDRALEGLHLQRLNGRFARLETGEPRAFRYRLEAGDFMNEDPSSETRELYEDMGWEYVCPWGGFYVYRTADAGAPELHTDPKIQALSMKKQLRRAFFGDMIAFLAVLILAVILICMSAPGQGRPLLLQAVDAGAGTVLYLTGALLVLLALLVWDVLRLSLVYRRLKRGEPMTRRRNYARSKALGTLSFVLVILLTLVPYGLRLAEGPRPVYYSPADSFPGRLPFLTLEELETEAALWQEMDTSNMVRHWEGTLAEHISLIQHGSLPGVPETVRLAGHYYRLSTEGLAEMAAENLLRYTEKENAVSFFPLSADGAQVWLSSPLTAEDGTGQFLILQKGCCALQLYYHGIPDIAGLVPLCLEKLNEAA